MQPITKEKILHLASLSRIAVDEAACADLSCDITELAALADHLEPLLVRIDSPADAVGIDALRVDAVTEGLERETFLATAPATDGETLLVPRTVEE